MKLLRDAMRREAAWIWYEKAQAARLGLFLNEETITETILLNLARRFHGGKLLIRPFTKAAETKNGADWEFWVVQGHDSLGFRVQAKRLFPSGYYGSLHPSRSQTSNLIGRAGNCLPVFALYNDADCYMSLLPNCGCAERRSEYRGPSFWGCLLIPARAVQKLGSNDHRALAPRAIPWHCLLCDHSGSVSGATFPKRVAKNYHRLLDGGDSAETEDIAPDDRILALEKIASDGLSGPQWLANYFEERKLAGLALISVQGGGLD